MRLIKRLLTWHVSSNCYGWGLSDLTWTHFINEDIPSLRQIDDTWLSQVQMLCFGSIFFPHNEQINWIKYTPLHLQSESSLKKKKEAQSGAESSNTTHEYTVHKRQHITLDGLSFICKVGTYWRFCHNHCHDTKHFKLRYNTSMKNHTHTHTQYIYQFKEVLWKVCMWFELVLLCWYFSVIGHTCPIPTNT